MKAIDRMKEEIQLTIISLVLMIPIYLLVSFCVFQYRNPKSNEMSLFRHFNSVITFRKLDQYQ